MGEYFRMSKSAQLNRSILYSAGTLMVLTVGIKLLAFIKQSVLAGWFGADPSLDLYLLTADTLGDFSAAIFSALSIATMTFYISIKEKNGQGVALAFIKRVFKIFFPVAILLALIFFISSDNLAEALAIHYTDEKRKIVSEYIRYLSPTIIFLFVTYLIVSILDAEKKFWPGKMIGFTLSIFIITATIFWGNKYGTKALIIAYTVAYFAHMIMVLFCARKYVFGIPKVQTVICVKPFLKMMIPIIFGNLAVELNALIDKLLATNVGSGALSVQTFGSTLNSFVVSILIVAPTGVLVSYLSTSLAKQQADKVKAYTRDTITLLLALLLPIAVITFVWSDKIVSIVYQRGAFTSYDVQRTAETLRGYALGFPLLAVRETLIKAHLAFKDSKTVMTNSAISIICNIILSIFFCEMFGLFGISLATSIAGGIAMMLCMATIQKHIKYLFNYRFLLEIGKLLISCIPIAAVALCLKKATLSGYTFIDFLILIIVAAGIHGLVLYGLKTRTFLLVKRKIQRK